MIDLTKLKTFITVAELGSFSRASEILYVTQPAVTQQIKSLEKNIGCRLFQRNGGRIVLTEEGERIYKMVKKLLDSYEGLMEEMSRIKKEFKETIFIGVSSTLGEYRIPELLARFHSSFPSINIKLFIDSSSHIEEGVSNSTLNVGIIERVPSDSKLDYKEFAQDEIIFVVSSKSPILYTEIEPQKLSEFTLIMRESSSSTRKVIKEALEKLGVKFDELKIGIETNSTRTILKIIKSGYGAGFLSKSLIEKELENNELREIKIKGFKLEKSFNIIFQKEYGVSFLANKFIKFLELEKDIQNVSPGL